MVKDVTVYGDIVPFIGGKDEIDLKTFINSIKALNLTPNDTLRVGIHTLGGCTVTAFSMFNYLRRLVNEKVVKSITTRVDGYCASSGVIVLLAGDERIGNDFANPFIHEAWTYLESGNASELKEIAEDLTRTNNLIANLYNKVTTIPVQTAIDLMVAETWVSAKDCMNYGFYTKLENVEGAEASIEVFNSLRGKRDKKIVNNKKIDLMSKKKSIFNKLKEVVALFQNKMILDSAGVEIDFYELEDGDTPNVGDVATIDGKPAGEYNDGVVTLVDGTIYKFSGEELTEIVEPSTEVIEDKEDADGKDAEIEALKKKIEELTASNETQVATYNSLKEQNKKLKSERNTAVSVLNQISSIKDDQLKRILDGEEVEPETEDTDSDDNDEFEGFPTKQSQRSQNKVKPSTKITETGSFIKEMNLNLFQANRK